MPPLPPVTKCGSHAAPFSGSRGRASACGDKRVDALVRIRPPHIGLGVGQMPARDSLRARSTSPAAIVSASWCGVERAALAQRRVGAAGRALVGPLLFVAGPQRLQAADHRDDGVVAAAAHDFVVELTADLGEARPVFRCARPSTSLSLLEFGTRCRRGRALGSQGRTHRIEFLQRRAEIGDNGTDSLCSNRPSM
jgi:hypothetical protein